MTRRRFISTSLLMLAALLLGGGSVQADNILDFVFEGQTEDKRGYSITNLNGHSLEGKSFEFSFGVDRSQLSDSDSSSNKAKFLNGLTKGFFKIGNDLYEGQGDLTDYEIAIHNNHGGRDKFAIKFNNFFGDEVYKNHNARAPKDFTIILEDKSETVFDQDPTAENFPDLFDIADWSNADFEIEWHSGTKLGGTISAMRGGTAVPEPPYIFALVLVFAVGLVYSSRKRNLKLMNTSR